ncbi:hypothetical protein HDU96_003808, partial [Phlyctochytrium bullatum]
MLPAATAHHHRQGSSSSSATAGTPPPLQPCAIVPASQDDQSVVSAASSSIRDSGIDMASWKSSGDAAADGAALTPGRTVMGNPPKCLDVLESATS